MKRRLRNVTFRIGATLSVVLLLAPRIGTRAHRAHVSRDLEAHVARRSGERIRVIVHGDQNVIEALAARHGLRVARLLDDAGVIEANSAEIEALQQDSEIDHLSGDLPIRAAMSVTNVATGANQIWAGVSGLPGVTGKGVSVAVIDSGIKTHAALSNKVVANIAVAAGGATDTYGHGTHIAGIIAGNGKAAANVTALYTGGVAPGALLINVRVLGADGSGLTSDVIAGIDWAINNRGKYNIRVINLSLGHPVMESSATDPLCEAVARAVQAGIVVVASAGNVGKTSTGEPVLGGISSPGNSPYAITVGALNTRATTVRTDDVVTTYSSRGPTRFDLRMKPDLVAPGNKIVSLLADASYVKTNYPLGYVAGSGTNAYYMMSGTSMATAAVSGAVALLLEANPKLTPSLVKLALQMSATYMPEAGLIGAGAGSINLVLARRIVSAGLTDPLPASSIAGSPVLAGGVAFWDAGTLSDRLYSSVGTRILWGDQLTTVWTDPSRIIWGDLNLLGLANPNASLTANRIIWGDVSLSATSTRIIWGDSVTDAAGFRIIWGDSTLALNTDPERIIWGDSIAGSGDPF
jgi:serine protease AprX